MEILAARMLVRPVNPARTLSFYRDVLQLAVYREFPGGTVFFLGGGYLEVSGQATAAEAKSAAASQRPPAGEERTAPPPSDTEPDERIRLWIQVRDLATAYHTLLDRGATVVRAPRWEPWGLNEMWVADPDGLRIGIVEVPPQHPLRRDTRGWPTGRAAAPPEDSEFTEPWQRARDAGYQTTVVGLRQGVDLKGKNGHSTTADQAIADVRVDDFDALVIPGGYSPDKLRINEGMVEFTREFVQSGKPVAAICHAGWMLAEAVVVRDRRLTSVRNIRTDLVNAGADWVDQEVVVDGNLITSRTPADLRPFCDARRGDGPGAAADQG